MMINDNILDFIETIKRNSETIKKVEIENVSYDELILIHDAILKNTYITIASIKLKSHHFRHSSSESYKIRLMQKEILQHLKANFQREMNGSLLVCKRI